MYFKLSMHHYAQVKAWISSRKTDYKKIMSKEVATDIVYSLTFGLRLGQKMGGGVICLCLSVVLHNKETKTMPLESCYI